MLALRHLKLVWDLGYQTYRIEGNEAMVALVTQKIFKNETSVSKYGHEKCKWKRAPSKVASSARSRRRLMTRYFHPCFMTITPRRDQSKTKAMPAYTSVAMRRSNVEILGLERFKCATSQQAASNRLQMLRNQKA